MVREILKTADIAKVVGCSSKELRAKISRKELTCARIRVSKGRRYCYATVSGLADSLGISREEVIRRVENNQ